MPHALTEQQNGVATKLVVFIWKGNKMRAYEPELKRQSAEWRHEGSPRRQKFRQNPSPVKLMVVLAYDVQGVILCHFVPHGETVNAQYYAA